MAGGNQETNNCSEGRKMIFFVFHTYKITFFLYSMQGLQELVYNSFALERDQDRIGPV